MAELRLGSVSCGDNERWAVRENVQEDEGGEGRHVALLEDTTNQKSAVILVVLDDKEQDGQQYPPDQAPNHICRTPRFVHSTPLQSKDVADEGCEQNDCPWNVHLLDNLQPGCVGRFCEGWGSEEDHEEAESNSTNRKVDIETASQKSETIKSAR